MDIYKIELTEEQKNNFSFRFTETQLSYIKSALNERQRLYSKIKKYYIGKNEKIIKKHSSIDYLLNNKAPLPYGRLLATTTIGYMLKRDPEILIKDNEKLQKSMEQELINAGGYNAIKKALANTIIYGVGYTLVFQSDDNNKVAAKIQSLHPTECIAVYDYGIIPKLLAVVRQYTITNSLTLITEIYYQDAIVIYKNNSIINIINHSAGCVPVAVCRANDESIGVIEPVIDLIDSLDVVMNSDLDEIQKFSLAILVAYGISIDKETLNNAKEGAALEISTIDPNSRLEYLTREINDTYRGDLKTFLVDKIHKLSQVPDFSDPNFSGISGIALEYKLMGFENLCGDIEINMIESIKQVLYLINIINNLGTSNIDKNNLWITMSRNLPRDDEYKLNNANIMKNMGLSKETYIGYISDYVDDVSKEIKREEKEAESISLFANGNYDMNNNPEDEEVNTEEENKGNN